MPAAWLACSFLGRPGSALYSSAPDGNQPQELVDRPPTSRVWTIFHGYLALVHAGQRGVPDDPPAARGRRAGDALWLFQKHGESGPPYGDAEFRRFLRRYQWAC